MRSIKEKSYNGNDNISFNKESSYFNSISDMDESDEMMYKRFPISNVKKRYGIVFYGYRRYIYICNISGMRYRSYIDEMGRTR